MCVCVFVCISQNPLAQGLSEEPGFFKALLFKTAGWNYENVPRSDPETEDTWF